MHEILAEAAAKYCPAVHCMRSSAALTACIHHETHHCIVPSAGDGRWWRDGRPTLVALAVSSSPITCELPGRPSQESAEDAGGDGKDTNDDVDGVVLGEGSWGEACHGGW